MVREMQIHIVLKRISVGKLFLILAQISADDVARVKKCIYHNSTPNTKPGTMMIALAIQLQNSIVL
jgi:hypothetical protein